MLEIFSQCWIWGWIQERVALRMVIALSRRSVKRGSASPSANLEAAPRVTVVLMDAVPKKLVQTMRSVLRAATATPQGPACLVVASLPMIVPLRRSVLRPTSVSLGPRAVKRARSVLWAWVNVARQGTGAVERRPSVMPRPALPSLSVVMAWTMTVMERSMRR